MMCPTGEHHHPDKSHHKAEDRDKHDPALRIVWHYQCARHQDPHQTTKNLQQHVYMRRAGTCEKSPQALVRSGTIIML